MASLEGEKNWDAIKKAMAGSFWNVKYLWRINPSNADTQRFIL
jgi:hypothetical protein